MPPPTHCDPSSPSTGKRLKPYTTINQTLRQIPRSYNAPDHQPHTWPPEKYLTPYSGDGILPRAMTTKGGQNYHPSGTRDLTLREYACLQSFPIKHVFVGGVTEMRRQIGNGMLVLQSLSKINSFFPFS